MKRFGVIPSLRLVIGLATPLAATALASFAATGQAANAQNRAQNQAQPMAVPTNWSAHIEARDSGHIIGNPEAENRLVEFMSYTCSSCAAFARTGDPVIKLFVVPRGKVSFEIRHLLRDPIDLTATLLTHCGDTDNFLGNHHAIISRQAEWLDTAKATTQAQRTRWSFGTNIARRRAIASDLGFYAIMEDRGYSRPQIDRCLADEAQANILADATQRDVETFGLQATPSFVLDGTLLDGVHDWDALKPALGKLD